MAKKKIEENQESKKEQKQQSDSVVKRKKLSKQKKLSRYSGFILLIITVILGFLFWVSGEINESGETRDSGSDYEELETTKGDGGVIIIE